MHTDTLQLVKSSVKIQCIGLLVNKMERSKVSSTVESYSIGVSYIYCVIAMFIASVYDFFIHKVA